MKNWYAVYTQPRNEELAGEHLQRQGFDVFLPRYLKRRSHARRIDTVPAPLFPRYLFVAFDSNAGGWRGIRSTRGVIDLVRNGINPVPVSGDIIEEIRRRQDDQGFVVLVKHLNLKRGSRIRIDEGPFADYEAIFESQRDDERVVALLSLLGRKVVVDLPIRAVVPA
ncbi:MAG: transcription termination/antitermination NusG family protein [Hyphomicrobiales bacterium]